MQRPDVPANEAQRLAELRSLGLLDSAPEDRFDRITRLAQRLFGVSTALVTLVDEDRQWFKSKSGLELSETPRDVSFCAHAILGRDIMTVPDATKDDRFMDNPFVVENPGVRFYAGCPIVGPGGATLGTFCIIDQQPRELSSEEHDSLRDLADMVENEIAANTMAHTDPLTGLGNRRGFEAAAAVVVDINRRCRVDTTVLFFDLDQFKSINDRFGHVEGDRALREFAQVMSGVLRGSDVLARLGGDEFVALLSGSSSYEPAVERMRAALADRNRDGGHDYELETSIGSAVMAWDSEESLESLLHRADEAMYENKRRR